MKTDYDKTEQLIDDVLVIIEDVQKKTDEESAGGSKIVWTESLDLVISHGVKAVRSISSMKEIAAEIIDTDEEEAEAAAEKIAAKFGGSKEAIEAIKLISGGAASISQGIQILIELKKK